MSPMQGAVANQVETEQLVQIRGTEGGLTASFVQMRGSIPLMWSQIPNIKYKPATQVAPLEDSERAFDNHVKGLLKSYEVIPWACSTWDCLCEIIGARLVEWRKIFCTGLRSHG